VLAYVAFTLTLAITSALTAGNSVYEKTEAARDRPLKGIIQVAQIVVWVIGIVLIISALAEESPMTLLAGIGAMTAVLLLVFKDTILGLVASIQLSANDMVRVGDWIEMPAYGADGDVIEVALHTVKVQNWDKTITSIPTHKLIEHSFKNWRGMQESGGRRIKRAFFVDMTSIRFLTPEEIDRLENFSVLQDYIREKRRELEEYNRRYAGEPGVIVNARRLTNVGTLRAYLVGYLGRHPKIHQQMTTIVRQLAPTSEGLPIELYVFTNTTAWVDYEGIQSDIFDHIFSIIPEFGLRVFQGPSGADLREIGGVSRG
jgi:miniconductance mechanosensitive channel